MAQVKTTLTITLDEANLVLKLLEEGERARERAGKRIREEVTSQGKTWAPGDPDFDRYQRLGREVMEIQTMRRGLKGLSS